MPLVGQRLGDRAGRSWGAAMGISIRGLDHLVLTVASIERTVEFYGRVLGMEARRFVSGGTSRVALHFGGQKLNLHEVGKVVDPNVRHAAAGSADLCLLTDTPIDEVIGHLDGCGVPAIAGPVERTGARRRLRSVYFHDPDENLVEVANELAASGPADAGRLARVVGFVMTSAPERARAFYGEALGFTFLGDDGFALTFDAHGTRLRVGKAQAVAAAPHTVLGWEVEDLAASVRALSARGVRFEQFGLPFLQQDALGIWIAPGGDQVAWFKDPDGNVLSLSQHGRGLAGSP